MALRSVVGGTGIRRTKEWSILTTTLYRKQQCGNCGKEENMRFELNCTAPERFL
jgi:hypothetical protein